MTMKDITQEALPVAVYCTIKKKCVMIFASSEKCDRYVFDKRMYTTSRTRYLSYAKGKTAKNAFKSLLAFRLANTQQKEILGDLDLVILDDEFLRYDVKVNSQMRTTR